MKPIPNLYQSGKNLFFTPPVTFFIVLTYFIYGSFFIALKAGSNTLLAVKSSYYSYYFDFLVFFIFGRKLKLYYPVDDFIKSY